MSFISGHIWVDVGLSAPFCVVRMAAFTGGCVVWSRNAGRVESQLCFLSDSALPEIVCYRHRSNAGIFRKRVSLYYIIFTIDNRYYSICFEWESFCFKEMSRVRWSFIMSLYTWKCSHYRIVNQSIIMVHISLKWLVFLREIFFMMFISSIKIRNLERHQML